MLPFIDSKVYKNVKKTEQTIVRMGGINYSDNIRDGDLVDSDGISARRYPYISTAGLWSIRDSFYTGVSSYAAFGEDEFCVKGTKFYHNKKEIGSVTAGNKQFALVNKKLCIFPDKKIYDMQYDRFYSIEVQFATTRVDYVRIFSDHITWDGRNGTDNIPEGMFYPGDTVHIKLERTTGTATSPVGYTFFDMDVTLRDKDKKQGRWDKYKKVEVSEEPLASTDTLYVTNTLVAEDIGSSSSSDYMKLTIERKAPDFDFVCESDNRLFGCNSAENVIYASALGDPRNFNTFNGIATDSYSLAIASPGPWTGCAKLGSSILFFKEDRMHKILGSSPSDYSMYAYEVDGVKPGCSKSLCVIDNNLFYLGNKGVNIIADGMPALISPNFGNLNIIEAVGGSDEDTYYMSANCNGKWALFAYEKKHGIWVKEKDYHVSDFARHGSLTSALISGTVYTVNEESADPEVQWRMQFTPFYETMDGRKIYSSLSIRFELPEGSFVRALVRFDGGEWKEVRTISGCVEGVVTMPIVINRCDKFELMLEGEGACTIHQIKRSFRVGGDV